MSHNRRHDYRRRGGRSPHGHYREFQGRRRHGWGMGLYRNRREGRICGVAAGLADYWDVAPWVVRLVFIGAFLFTGTLAIWAYVAGCLLLSPRPDQRRGRGRRGEEETHVEVNVSMQAQDDPYGPEMEYDEEAHNYRPRRIFRYSDSASVRLARARERLDDAMARVESMERYVTSRRFRLNREFSRL
jgi:phage shock protein C